MLVLVVVAVSTSPSPAKVPPVIATVALEGVVLFGSVTVTVPDRFTAALFSVNCTLATTLLSVGLWMVIPMVSVCAELRLLDVLPSLMTQVTTRFGFEPELLGSALVAVNVTQSSTCW